MAAPSITMYLASELPTSSTCFPPSSTVTHHNDSNVAVAMDTDPGSQAARNLVTPSDLIAVDTAYMRGHGTYVEGTSLHASVAGRVQRVNKLISVKPLKTRYNGDIGDVIVGRVLEVGTKRWKVETNARLDSVLMLSSVNLPGGELRRKTIDDELMMREYLAEGDLISAEVQSVFTDGSVSLHTRSLKYGKLSQGTVVKVSPSLVTRRKSHFHNLPCGPSLILGCNGFIWISPIPHSSDSDPETGGFVQNLGAIPLPEREATARLRNVIVLLAEQRCMLDERSIMAGYEVSLAWTTKELLDPRVKLEVGTNTRTKLEMEST